MKQDHIVHIADVRFWMVIESMCVRVILSFFDGGRFLKSKLHFCEMQVFSFFDQYCNFFSLTPYAEQLCNHIDGTRTKTRRPWVHTFDAVFALVLYVVFLGISRVIFGTPLAEIPFFFARAHEELSGVLSGDACKNKAFKPFSGISGLLFRCRTNF